jgi:hypothetical protein
VVTTTCSKESTLRVERGKAAGPMDSVAQPSSESIQYCGTKRSNANNVIPCRRKLPAHRKLPRCKRHSLHRAWSCTSPQPRTPLRKANENAWRTKKKAKTKYTTSKKGTVQFAMRSQVPRSTTFLNNGQSRLWYQADFKPTQQASCARRS